MNISLAVTNIASALLIVLDVLSASHCKSMQRRGELSVPGLSDSSKEQRGLVAVIEDDASLNMAILRQLRAAGFRTRSFRSGREVLAAHGHIADCFVLDVHLPDMTGFELMCQIAARSPIVVITAHDDPLHRRAASEIRAVAYLTKPFSREVLLDAVTRAIAAV